MKYFKINGTYEGYLSNRTLIDIREQYIINGKINNIKDFGIKAKQNKDTHILELHIFCKNEWISWSNFLYNKLYLHFL